MKIEKIIAWDNSGVQCDESYLEALEPLKLEYVGWLVKEKKNFVVLQVQKLHKINEKYQADGTTFFCVIPKACIVSRKTLESYNTKTKVGEKK